jgi:hypothetical protein
MAPSTRNAAVIGHLIHSRNIDPSSFADGVSQRLEVIGMWQRGREFTGVPNNLPTAGNGEPNSVILAEIIGMRLRKCGQRADDRHGIGIDVGQRRDSRLAATSSGTSTDMSHSGRQYPHSRDLPR